MKTKFSMMIAAILVLSFLSCQKDSDSLDQASLQMADDDAVSDAIYDDIFNTADNAAIILESFDAKSDIVIADSCPAITISTTSQTYWPKTVTIDYGTGCTGFNDNTRSGKIIITITGPRMQSGSLRTITFENYYFNEMKVEGTTVLESSYNNSQHLVVSVTLTGGKVTLTDGKTIERQVNHEREWIAGLATRNIWDDECLITGNAQGKNINGVQYNNTIITPLHWKRACRFLVAGVVKIERQDKPTLQLDYGTGDCDAKAVISRGDQSKEILLRFRHPLMP